MDFLQFVQKRICMEQIDTELFAEKKNKNNNNKELTAS